jgi:hypothetical protein
VTHRPHCSALLEVEIRITTVPTIPVLPLALVFPFVIAAEKAGQARPKAALSRATTRGRTAIIAPISFEELQKFVQQKNTSCGPGATTPAASKLVEPESHRARRCLAHAAGD